MLVCEVGASPPPQLFPVVGQLLALEATVLLPRLPSVRLELCDGVQGLAFLMVTQLLLLSLCDAVARVVEPARTVVMPSHWRAGRWDDRRQRPALDWVQCHRNQ